MILPGAFSAAQKRRAEFWIAHDPSRVVGSTDNGLGLHSDERGLAFRFRFPNTALGNEAKRLVADKEYMGMSVGCAFQYRTETICDESVHIIHTAYLEEISLVKAGAIEKAFAVRAKPDRPLSENCHTGSLASDWAYVQFMRACQKTMAAVR